MNKFTPRASKVLDNAESISREMGNNWVGTEHLLIAILSLKNGIVPKIFDSCGLDMDALRVKSEKLINALGKSSPPLPAKLVINGHTYLLVE